ncbi:protein MAIN-LIKE 2-like [Arachis hypogaea]|uniref:protein MAIN-LIKE 2-like n=1 Tax=Arachis hypogaea TaxID=3818 RepID=UPI003B20F4B5
MEYHSYGSPWCFSGYDGYDEKIGQSNLKTDVVLILGLPTNGLPITGPTLSSYKTLKAKCLDQFGVAPRKADCRGSFIKLTWIRGLKYHLVLVDDIQIQRIIHFSWGSTCLAHLYRALCRATRVDHKEIDDPLTLLLTWAWIRLPFIAPIPGNPRLFPIVNRWHNWNRENRSYRFRNLAHFRRALDDLQEGHFVWETYAIGQINPDVLKRQFGLTQGVPHREWDLGEAHDEVLTGPKNQDWSGTHSF